MSYRNQGTFITIAVVVLVGTLIFVLTWNKKNEVVFRDERVIELVPLIQTVHPVQSTWPVTPQDIPPPSGHCSPDCRGDSCSGCVGQCRYKKAYEPKDFTGPGPMNKFQGVPVQMDTLKITNQDLNFPYYDSSKTFVERELELRKQKSNYPYFSSNGFGNQYVYGKFPQNGPLRLLSRLNPDDFRWEPEMKYVGSVSDDVVLPFRDVATKWDQIGLLERVCQCKDKNNHDKDCHSGSNILNLFRRPIAPMQNLFQYSAQDKNGFIILLDQKDYLETNDIIHHVTGHGGPWKVKNYAENRYIYV